MRTPHAHRPHAHRPHAHRPHAPRPTADQQAARRPTPQLPAGHPHPQPARRGASAPAAAQRRAPGARVRAALALLTAGLLVSGCSVTFDSGDEEVRSPFTGEQVEPGPVLAVKLDNAPDARPHTGLASADIVYASQVEGGLSRLTAIYSGDLPAETGPVRSARESDLQLLRTFGDPAFAFSGARSAVLPLITQSPVEAVTPDSAPGAFFRSGDRDAPHNLFLRPTEALDDAPGASDASDIGFRFGEAPEGGRETTEETVRFPSASFGFAWSAEDGAWRVSMDGSPAQDTGTGQVTAATVVVQYVDVHDSQFPGTPFTETVGSGAATVLRDGRAHDARWQRASSGDGTRFTGEDGERLNFATGPVWVVLAPAPA
ncbi:DUF3048 domain-containing protein [Streptomyces bohaiensis]|uniref:DUF3048 domain-containing protein n=1 Tax=Streptomyces bohaiensis TaxID=1431344 RepID=UPI003B7DEA8C